MTTGKILAVILAIILFCVLAIFAIIRLATPEDYWICEKGEWLPHGNPSAAKPESLCPGKPEVATTTEPINDKISLSIQSDKIKVDVKNNLLSGPGTDSNGATGTWRVLVATSTEIFEQLSSSTKNKMTFNELAQTIKNWVGPKWPIKISGKLNGTSSISATAVYYTIQ